MTDPDIQYENEIWKPIDRFPGYEVSNFGRVRSVDRVRPCGHSYRTHKGRILSPVTGVEGYLQIGFPLPKKRTKTIQIHKLVMQAFIGDRPKGYQIRHLNGVKTDNTLSNLRYGTAKENTEDKRKHGTIPFGEDHHNCVLTLDLVLEARRRYKPRCRINGIKAISEEFGVNDKTLMQAVLGKRAWIDTP